jgi:cytochrome P450
MSQTAASRLPTFPFARADGDVFNPPLCPFDARTAPGNWRAAPADGRAAPGEPPPAPVRRVVLSTGRPAWLVSGHDEVRRMLRSPAFSANSTRPGFPALQLPQWPAGSRAGMFIRMDAPEHARLRRIVTPEFMIKNMRRLEPLIHRSVGEALDTLRAAGPPADLIECFALPVPSIVICHLLGVPYADHEFFQQRSHALLRRTRSAEEVRDAVRALRAYLGELVAEKQRAGGSDDLIGRLAIERVATGQLSADEVVGLALLLLIAGHETTANMIGLSVLLLLHRHPAQLAALRTEPDLASTMVEELLRYLTIVRSGVPRVAVADIEIGGQLIRAGEGAIALLSGANRDGTVFAEPDEFDARREAQQHMAFGFGAHQCVGQPLARAELRVALVELANRFPRLALAVPIDHVVLRDDYLIYGVDRLPVTW